MVLGAGTWSTVLSDCYGCPSTVLGLGHLALPNNFWAQCRSWHAPEAISKPYVTCSPVVQDMPGVYSSQDCSGMPKLLV